MEGNLGRRLTLRGLMNVVVGQIALKEYGTPKVSMGIPAYNTENYIVRCIDTVLAQSQPDVEIIGLWKYGPYVGNN